MRHLPKGKKFYAKMCGVRDQHPVRDLELSSRLILCEMLTEGSENPTVRFYGKSSSVDVTDEESGVGSWFVYEGNEDGSGFISEESKLEYQRLVKEENNAR